MVQATVGPPESVSCSQGARRVKRRPPTSRLLQGPRDSKDYEQNSNGGKVKKAFCDIISMNILHDVCKPLRSPPGTRTGLQLENLHHIQILLNYSKIVFILKKIATYSTTLGACSVFSLPCFDCKYLYCYYGIVYFFYYFRFSPGCCSSSSPVSPSSNLLPKPSFVTLRRQLRASVPLSGSGTFKRTWN